MMVDEKISLEINCTRDDIKNQTDKFPLFLRNHILLARLLSYVNDRNKLSVLSSCKFLLASREKVNLIQPIQFRYCTVLTHFRSSIKSISVYNNRDLYTLSNKLSKFPTSTKWKSVNSLAIHVFTIHNSLPSLTTFPSTLTKLNINSIRGIELLPGTIPSSVKYLSLGNWSDLSVIPGSIPTSVTHLHLGENKLLIADLIPNSVTHLQMQFKYDSLAGSEHIPESVVDLAINDCGFSETVKNSLKPSIRHLTFLTATNEMTYSYRTYDPRNLFPQGITHLNYGFHGNNRSEVTYDKAIPYTVTHLKLPEFFNCPLFELYYVCNLENLVTSRDFNRPINNSEFPDSLKYIRFGFDFNKYFLPGTFPKSVTHLTFGFRFNQSISTMNLPSNIVYLHLDYNFNQPIDDLPEHLEFMALGREFSHPIETLPKSLKTLIIKSNVPILQLNALENLEKLALVGTFNMPLNQITFPNNLKYLQLGDDFNQVIQPLELPSLLTDLIIGNSFSQKLVENSLPASLKTLTVGNSFPDDKSQFNLDTIPRGITNITLPHRIYLRSLVTIYQLFEDNQLPSPLVNKTLPLNLDENLFNDYSRSYEDTWFHTADKQWWKIG
ncbi:hypothetical protein DLAC_09957 [Tieghemostelium lacteum]|uniref:FNIP repeat-containing protein n=1 Tax=Tieghemostelium lacteum TaxID=361077 RepID=A0A151Z5R7_TIELA|nr:hypothetical protein DLAC_09957 [Tieghemostelium lacteum]|eukprot:KYQ89299.1 hypothetical protein DLAC_09957 [Tieghemostelium lacteum]